MTAACTTFDQIESRTATSVALAIYTRRVLDGFVATTLGRPLLLALGYRLAKLMGGLKSDALDKLTNEQLNEIGGLLKQLFTCLVRLVRSEELQSHRSLRSSVRRIEENIEDLESVIENIYLALDPRFNSAMTSAIEKLGLRVEADATMSR